MPPSSRSSRRMVQSGDCRSSFRVSVGLGSVFPFSADPPQLVILFVFQRSRPSWSGHRWLGSRMRLP
jgi:hypothetical protein